MGGRDNNVLADLSKRKAEAILCRCPCAASASRPPRVIEQGSEPSAGRVTQVGAFLAMNHETDLFASYHPADERQNAAKANDECTGRRAVIEADERQHDHEGDDPEQA